MAKIEVKLANNGIGWSDPNPKDIFYHGHQVGNAIQLKDGRWLKIERTVLYRLEWSGLVGYGSGRIVSAEKAAALRAAWKLQHEVRRAELSLHVERNADDYQQARVDDAEQALANARRAAGMTEPIQ
jgi:hypothetical protein